MYSGPRSYNNRDRVQNKAPTRFINQTHVVQQLLEYIYRSVELANYKYKILQYDPDMALIDSDDFYLSPNYSGINCLLVFIKLKDKYYSFLIDRRKMSYDMAHLNQNNVKITYLDVRLGDGSIHKGSIFDGVLLYPKLTDGKKVFVINDVYRFMGKDMSGEKITNKLMNINAFLNAYYQDDPTVNNIKLVTNRMYGLSDIVSVVKSKFTDVPYNDHIKGIAFYPTISSTKFIFLYNNAETNSINSPFSESSEKNKNSEPIIASVQSDKAKESLLDFLQDTNLDKELVATFEMRKTEIVDVYKLYLSKKIKTGDKIQLKSKKIGIAYIPTQECTKMCIDMFKDGNKRAFVKCRYVQDKDKWIPVGQDKKAKSPDQISKLEKIVNS